MACRDGKRLMDGPAELKRALQAQIDSFLIGAGITDPEVLTDEQGVRHFMVGSAQGRAWAGQAGDEVRLFVEALLLPLPSDGELILPLLRELLEFNHGLPGSAHIGIRDEHVWVSWNRRVEETRPEDVAAAFAEVMGLADSIDDPLLSKYAGTVKGRRRHAP